MGKFSSHIWRPRHNGSAHSHHRPWTSLNAILAQALQTPFQINIYLDLNSLARPDYPQNVCTSAGATIISVSHFIKSRMSLCMRQMQIVFLSVFSTGSTFFISARTWTCDDCAAMPMKYSRHVHFHFTNIDWEWKAMIKSLTMRNDERRACLHVSDKWPMRVYDTKSVPGWLSGSAAIILLFSHSNLFMAQCVKHGQQCTSLEWTPPGSFVNRFDSSKRRELVALLNGVRQWLDFSVR